MGTITVKAKDLKRRLNRDLKKLQKRVMHATHKTAELGRIIAFAKAPVAFGQLRDELAWVPTDTGAKIMSTAPYSAAVETGSRPHMPPIAPILEWVKLRGMEGLDVGAGAIGHPGSVMRAIHSHGTAEATHIDAPLKVAWAIALAIKKNGTKPTWFMQRSVPEIETLLDSYIKSLFSEDL